MDWLKELLKINPNLALWPALGMGLFTFVGHLAIALSDGQLDSNEIHQLLSGASGLETAIVFLAILALRRKNDNK